MINKTTYFNYYITYGLSGLSYTILDSQVIQLETKITGYHHVKILTEELREKLHLPTLILLSWHLLEPHEELNTEN